jgi:hypothetical protein
MKNSILFSHITLKRIKLLAVVVISYHSLNTHQQESEKFKDFDIVNDTREREGDRGRAAFNNLPLGSRLDFVSN